MAETSGSPDPTTQDEDLVSEELRFSLQDSPMSGADNVMSAPDLLRAVDSVSGQINDLLEELYAPEGRDLYWRSRLASLGGRSPSEAAHDGDLKGLIDLRNRLRAMVDGAYL